MSHKHRHKNKKANTSYQEPKPNPSTESSGSGKLSVAIHGMHCASCEVLIERKLKKIEGVESVKVSQAKGRAEVSYTSKPSLTQLQEAIADTEYSIASTENNAPGIKPVKIRKNTTEDYLEIGFVVLIIWTAYLILKRLDILPKGLNVSDQMSYPFIFAIGLVAAVSSCIAVTGGLLVAVAGRYAETHPNLAGWQKFKPQLHFNIGRVLGYTFLGGLVGALGSVFTLSTRMTGVLSIAASLIMITLGFQLLNLFPGLQRLMPKMPKFFAHKVHDASSSSESKAGPFLLGASTFFLPCGFTQALQLYVLSKGSFTVGALTMLAFSLGTLPALLSLSALSSFLKGNVQKYFFRFAGVIVVLLGFSNINNGLALAGTNINLATIFSNLSTQDQTTVESQLPPITDGKQIIRMKVVNLEYQPSKFSVRQGIPVEWHIDGSQTGGCAGVLTAPDLDITASIAGNNDKVITFTPSQTGTFAFSCPMGMTTWGAAITVVADNPASPSASPVTNNSITPPNLPIPPSTTSAPQITTTPPATQNTQQFAMSVTRELGFSPNQFTAKKNIPVELIVDVQTPLSGCMSTMIGSDYDIAARLKSGKNIVRFTPTRSGTLSLTCPMGIPMGEFTITD